MARETKAERLAREETQRQLRLAETVAAYPSRLMALFERLNNQYHLVLKVQNGFFVVSDTNDRYRNEYELSYSWSANAQEVLEELEWKLTQLEEEQAEARRRSEVKKEAERKVRELLSDEERELLGL